MLNAVKSRLSRLSQGYSSGKTKLFVFLILAVSIIPNLLFAQFTQQGPKLVGTGALGNAGQGFSVAISSDGNTAIVGGLEDNGGTGAVWVFTRSSGVWTQQGPKLVGTGSVADAEQGWSVAISSDGNTAAVGGPADNNLAGAVWVFTRSGGLWTQQGPKLVGTGSVGECLQGGSVAISSDGNTAIVGGNGDNNQAGAVWVFTRSGGLWTQQGPKLVGTGALGNAEQGFSVAISSDGTAIEGGPVDNTGAGAVWVFYNPMISVRTISREVPKDFRLMQNYPNPFNPLTKIKFDIAKQTDVKLVIFDILGKEVGTLINEELKAGKYELSFDAAKYSSGVYFYKLITNDFVDTKEIVLLK